MNLIQLQKMPSFEVAELLNEKFRQVKKKNNNKDSQ